MRIITVVLLLHCSLGHAAETKPTGEKPVSPEQKQAHAKVNRLQKKLSQELKKNAPPEQIGDTKAKLQEERTKANGADAAEAAKNKSD